MPLGGLPGFLLVGLASIALGSTAASAQNFYKCTHQGKVTYSDTPCMVGDVRTIDPQRGPTPEDQEKARQRLQRGLSEQREIEGARAAQMARQAADRAAREQAESHAQATRAADAAAGERVLTHSRSGWDRKTRGQLEAERAAREGKDVPSTGAAWESEKVLTHGSRGWDSATRLDAARAEGARQRRADQAAERASGANVVPQQAPIPGGFVTDQHGRTWINQGATVLSPQTGRVCNRAGNIIQCP